MIRRIVGLSILVGSLALGATAPAMADPVAGSYSFDGDTTPTNGTGPWTLTAGLVSGSYSVLEYDFTTPVLFQDLSSIVVNYTNNYGGIANGSPRLYVVTSDGAGDDFFRIHWGPAGTFADNTPGAGTTGNLLALTDNGRYDLQHEGGSFYTDRAAALSLAGLFHVIAVGITVDSGGISDRSITINSLAINTTAAVPLPASAWLLMSGVMGLLLLQRRKVLSLS